MGAFTIRPATEADADDIARVHRDSILKLGASAYPSDIVAEWGKPRDGQRYLDAMKNGEVFFIARDESGKILGFSCYLQKETEHHVTAVYVAGVAARMGVGTALYHEIEKVARNRGATALQLHSSLNAAAFYQANGFVNLGEGEHRLSTGAMMPCVFMKKEL